MDPRHVASAQASSRVEIAVGRLPGFNGFAFSPGDGIAAGDLLAELGPAAATVLRDTVARRPADIDYATDALLAARIAFVPSSGAERPPDLRLGMPDVVPTDADLVPYFPVHFIGGMPLLLVGGYLLGGEFDTSTYLAWCQSSGSVRDHPLEPPPDPLAAVDSFLAGDTWASLRAPDPHEWMVRCQALRAVDGAYSTTDEERTELIQGRRFDIWERHREAFQRVGAVWDAGSHRYRASRTS